MRCKELLLALSDYVDGEIDPSLCAELEAHLADCNPCQVVLNTTRRTVQLYKGQEPYEIPLALHARLHAALSERWRSVAPGSSI